LLVANSRPRRRVMSSRTLLTEHAPVGVPAGRRSAFVAARRADHQSCSLSNECLLVIHT
jgi:hypothetical protein